MPSVDVVRRNTRTRIDPLIQSSPVLAERVVAPRSRDPGNTATSKRFIGGELVMTGANAASALRSTPARYLFLDEVDGYPSDVEGEGDPVSLAVKRTATFAGKRKIFMVSTPTVRDFSRIEAAYIESDQRRFYVPCPHCGALQVIEWAKIKWPPGEPQQAYLECSHCAGAVTEQHKTGMLRQGEWVPARRATGARRFPPILTLLPLRDVGRDRIRIPRSPPRHFPPEDLDEHSACGNMGRWPDTA